MIRSFLGESRLIIVRINYRLKRTKNQALHAQISERNQLIGLDGEIVVNKPSEILGEQPGFTGLLHFETGCVRRVKGKPEMWSDFINWQLRAAVQLRQAMLSIDNDNPAEIVD